MTGRFDGQVAIITGSGSQIGLGIEYAKLLAKNGAKIVIHGRKEQQVADAAAALSSEGYEVFSYVVDVADRLGVLEMVAAVVEKWGRIDILINNAGAVAPDMWPYSSQADYENLQQVLDANIKGTLHFMEAVWPHMQNQKGGVIVNVASNSLFGIVPTIAYPSSKAGVLSITRIAAFIGAADGIIVNAIAPCASSQLTLQLPDSPFKEKLIAEYPPEKAAAAAVALCAKDCGHTGAFFSLGGGQINRFNFANTACFGADDLDEAAASLKALAADDIAYEAVNSGWDDLRRYGFSQELYDYYGMRPRS